MYSRETELRHLQPNDVYKLGVILDDNNCWKKLMELIPKQLNAQTSSAEGQLDWEQTTASSELKYNNDHIRLIESAIKRPGESRLFSQILFDEWGTSGRKHERPTLGILLQLLVKAELFRAADFVAKNFLNESPPARPLNGPAAKIDISLTDEIFNDIDDLVNDTSYYPGTEALNDNANNYANSVADNNKDYYTKYQRMDKHVAINENVAPIPPPRTLRTARLQKQQLLQQQQTTPSTTTTTTEATTVEATCKSEGNGEQHINSFDQNALTSPQDIPKFSALLSNSNTTYSSTAIESEAITLPRTVSTNLSEAPIPLISLLANSTTSEIDISTSDNRASMSSTNIAMTENEVLPVISALNLNGERTQSDNEIQMSTLEKSENISPNISETSRSSSLSNDDSVDDHDNIDLPDLLANINDNVGCEHLEEFEEDYEDNSVPNLSIFDQRSSNNDSSLTTVTGTSGENSFELSMNDCCSSTSNENIPCLSALKQ